MRHRLSINWLTCMLVWALACGMAADAVGAEAQGAEKTYQVLGTGASAAGDESEGRQAAVTDALTAAVGRATQTLMGPEAFRQHFGELDGILFRQPQQYISSYKVLSQSQFGRQYRVLLEASVALHKIDQQLKSRGILESKAEIPTLLLLIAEQNIDDLAPRFWWGSNRDGSASSAMNTMADSLKAQGLTVLDPVQLRERKDVDWKRFDKAELTFREAAGLGQRVGAALVVVGNSLAVPSSAEVGSDMQALKGSVSAHVIDAENAEQVAKISETALGMHKNEVEAGNEALSNAGRIAGQALAHKIIQAWQTQAESVARIEVVVEGTQNLVRFVQFRRTLSELEGVEKVQIKQMGTDTAALEVDFKGTGQALAERLQKQSFKTFAIKLLEVTAAGLKLVLEAG